MSIVSERMTPISLEVDNAIRRQYGDYPVVSMATRVVDGRVVGSNPYYVAAANEILRSQGKRTFSNKDYWEIARNHQLDTLKKKYCCDTGLLVGDITSKPVNAGLARDFMSQFEKRGLSFSTVANIPLCQLTLRKDNAFADGLAFNLSDDFTIVEPKDGVLRDLSAIQRRLYHGLWRTSIGIDGFASIGPLLDYSNHFMRVFVCDIN